MDRNVQQALRDKGPGAYRLVEDVLCAWTGARMLMIRLSITERRSKMFIRMRASEMTGVPMDKLQEA